MQGRTNMTNKKRIGVLTSGGDCAGLNAAIRAVVLSATRIGWEVVGIEDGTMGLLSNPKRCKVLTPKDFDTTILRLGGTVLGTVSKGNPFHYPQPDGSFKDLTNDIIASLKELKLDGLIGIGGDGSMAILKKILDGSGINLVCIPKTIDNDVSETENAIGFETAAYVATEALDRLQPTAASHDRVMILEVMGRDAGNIAITSGIAGGADVILIPEIPYDIDKVVEKIKSIREEEDRNFALVVVSEAVKTADGSAVKVEHAGGEKRYGGIANYIGELIYEKTGFETRVTNLGHVQRGCAPIPYDRLIATAFGAYAVELVVAGKFNRMVAWTNRGVIDVPIEDAINKYQSVDLEGSLVHTARSLGICLGD